MPPIPEGGIDRSQWPRARLERSFRDRYPFLRPESVAHMAALAVRSGRIEGAPKGHFLKAVRRPTDRAALP
jgi:hypothetical protein